MNTATPFDDARAEQDDRALVTRAQAGDRHALEELVGRHQAWIYNIPSACPLMLAAVTSRLRRRPVLAPREAPALEVHGRHCCEHGRDELLPPFR